MARMRPEFIAVIRANKHLSFKDLRVGKKGNAICFCYHRKYCHCQGFDRSEQIVPPFSPLLPQRAVGQTMSWVGTPEARFRWRRWRRGPQRQHRRPVPLRRRSVFRPAGPLATVVLLHGPAENHAFFTFLCNCRAKTRATLFSQNHLGYGYVPVHFEIGSKLRFCQIWDPIAPLVGCVVATVSLEKYFPTITENMVPLANISVCCNTNITEKCHFLT